MARAAPSSSRARRAPGGAGFNALARLASPGGPPYKDDARKAGATMIVTCPECATRYLVDPRALGTSGRTVRCANCSNTWYQTPPDDAPRRIELPPIEPIAIERPQARIQLPAVAKPPRPSVLRNAGWLVMVLVLLAVGAGLVVERGSIVALWPTAEGLYKAVGLSMPAAEKVFDLRNIDTKDATENDQPTIIVTGEVVNITPVTRSAPKVKVSLNDVNDHELLAWTIPLTEDRLLPGQSVPFRTSSSRPVGAVAVSVAVVGGS